MIDKIEGLVAGPMTGFNDDGSVNLPDRIVRHLDI